MIEPSMLKLIMLPFTAALLGWITNWIAIKMLFYPKEPLVIFGNRFKSIHGLFPRHKEEFAGKTGDLFNQILKPNELINELQQSPLYNQLYRAFDARMDQGLFTAFMGTAKRKVIYAEFWKELTDVLKTNKAIESSIHMFVSQYIRDLNSDELFVLFDSYIGAHVSVLTWVGAILGFLIGCIQVGILVLL